MEFFFDDLRTSLAEQRRELELLETTEFDMNLAFRLQLEETIKASLQNLPSTSSSPLQQSFPKNDTVNLLSASSSAPQQSKSDIVRPPIREELSKPQQTWKDLTRSEPGRSKLREDRDPRIPREIFRAWRDRFGESSSGSGSSSNSKYNRDGDDVFRVYFKGLVSRERLNLAGIGVVIFDPRNRVVSEIRKPLISDGLNRVAVEAKALIEGLNAAIALEVKNIEVFFNFHVLYQFITGRWPPKQRKIAVLVNQVSHLSRQFTSCKTLLVRNGSKYAFELAKEAMDSHFKGPVESSNDKTVSETCIICLEDTDPERMFSVEKCEHRYCFSCMKQHVEVKLLNGMLPQCPHEKCKSALQVESCQKFLPPKLVETMNQRIKEASIPVSEKIYCPYPKCSVLMTKKEVTDGGERSGARKCLKCHGLFCIDCKVPWHINMTCEAYQRASPVPPAEDLKLKTLATKNLWRQCVKCNHMIELAEGCYHMTCRCGNEFCYNCGAEWKNKKATCACPLWDEDNVWYDHDFNDEGPIIEYDSDYEGSIIEYDSAYEGPIIEYASGYEDSIIEYASGYEDSIMEYASDYEGRPIIEYASDYEGRPIIEYASDYEGSIIEYDSDYEGGPIVEYASDYEGGSIIEYASDYEGGPIVEYASDYEGRPIIEYASDYEGPIIEYNSDYEVYESDDDYFF